MRSGKLARSRADRRNTLDCALLNHMIIEPSIDSRNDKRILQMQRDYDREQKMTSNNHTRAANQRSSMNYDDHHHDSVSVPGEPKCVESSTRLMSVKSRPVGCRISAPPTAFLAFSFPKADTATQNRLDFHETFSNLIKLGSNEKQDRNTKSIIISKEEQMWQTEVKDMIWLELQAFAADRTLEQQDKYLFAARQNISELLKEIINYKFTRKFSRMDSSTTNDSGISSIASDSSKSNN